MPIPRRLEEAGLKKTKHRQLILELIEESDCLLSAEDLYLTAKESDPSISLSTVYRSLEQFLRTNLVRTVSLEQENKTLYESAHVRHMHHLICTSCHKVIHLSRCPVKGMEQSIAEDHGFAVSSHTLEFYGVCAQCQQKGHSSE
jgi:Fur family ferric uptake transcriptional regulator